VHAGGFGLGNVQRTTYKDVRISGSENAYFADASRSAIVLGLACWQMMLSDLPSLDPKKAGSHGDDQPRRLDRYLGAMDGW
jgi:hypothetical protein